MNILFLSSFFAYTAILSLVGWYFYKQQKNATDFMVGDRSINYWVTAIATHATDMSAWLFMGYPGAIYAMGMPAAWSAIGLISCMFLTWQFVAAKLRIATEKYQALTLSSYFEKRFSDTSGHLRITSAAISLFFFTLYISAGIVALGRALEATFGFSYTGGVIIGTATVALYTILGGFVAIAWNDFLQGMFVLFIIITFPLYALYAIGGFSSIATAAHANNLSLALIPNFSSTTIGSLLVMGFGWGLGYFGQPHILINFMGIDNAKNIPKAKWVGISWQIITMSASTLIGLIGIAYFNPALANNELVFINMVKGMLGPLLAGLVLCAILAAAVSTMDSQILVSASILTEDIYKKLFHKRASTTYLLTVSRIAATLVIGLALLLSLNNNESIFALVRYAWCGLGSAFGPLVILSLYSKNITKQGALASMIIGGFTAGIWKYLPGVPMHEYAIIPGFVFSLISIILVSWATKE